MAINFTDVLAKGIQLGATQGAALRQASVSADANFKAQYAIGQQANEDIIRLGTGVRQGLLNREKTRAGRVAETRLQITQDLNERREVRIAEEGAARAALGLSRESRTASNATANLGISQRSLELAEQGAREEIAENQNERAVTRSLLKEFGLEDSDFDNLALPLPVDDTGSDFDVGPPLPVDDGVDHPSAALLPPLPGQVGSNIPLGTPAPTATLPGQVSTLDPFAASASPPGVILPPSIPGRPFGSAIAQVVQEGIPTPIIDAAEASRNIDTLPETLDVSSEKDLRSLKADVEGMRAQRSLPDPIRRLLATVESLVDAELKERSENETTETKPTADQRNRADRQTAATEQAVSTLRSLQQVAAPGGDIKKQVLDALSNPTDFVKEKPERAKSPTSPEKARFARFAKKLEEQADELGFTVPDLIDQLMPPAAATPAAATPAAATPTTTKAGVDSLFKRAIGK